MLPVARKFFIAALFYLALGLLAQAAAGFDLWLGLNPLAYTATTATQQLFLAGWLTQLGLAMAYDRWLRPPGPELPRQNFQFKIYNSPTLVLVLFNLGLPLAVLGQPGLLMLGGPWLGPVGALGGLLQLAAGLLFAGQAWAALRQGR